MAGIAAYTALQRLTKEGLFIEMVSVCGVATATAMLYACGCTDPLYHQTATEFLEHLQATDIDTAIAKFAHHLPLSRWKRKIPLIVNSVNVSDGTICAFCDRSAASTSRLQAVPLNDCYDVLSATIGPMDGLASYPYAGYALCDFSVWYGAPVYAPKMMGIDRMISIAFVPKSPQTPYEVLVKQRIAASISLSDASVMVELEKGDRDLAQYIQAVNDTLSESMQELYAKLLF